MIKTSPITLKYSLYLFEVRSLQEDVWPYIGTIHGFEPVAPDRQPSKLLESSSAKRLYTWFVLFLLSVQEKHTTPGSFVATGNSTSLMFGGEKGGHRSPSRISADQPVAVALKKFCGRDRNEKATGNSNLIRHKTCILPKTVLIATCHHARAVLSSIVPRTEKQWFSMQ